MRKTMQKLKSVIKVEAIIKFRI